MSHYLVYVIIPATGDAEALVERALAPFHYEVAGNKSWWDWYQIGGRWTGCLDGYDPEKDPANIETCDICAGTGIRTDEIGREMGQHKQALDADVAAEVGRTHGWCNGCRGRGWKVAWPTQWKRQDGDVQPARAAIGKRVPYRVVSYSEKAGKSAYVVRTFGGEESTEAEDRVQVETMLKNSDERGCRVVVVDCHD